MGAMSAILTKVLSAGMQRAFSLTMQKALRLRKIDSALKNIPAKSALVKTAFSDFEIVLGTYRGELTQSVSAFLDELAKSGLADAMIQHALLSADGEALKPTFSEMYYRFLPQDDGKCFTLFESLMISFSTTFAELSKDKSVHALLSAHHKEISNRLSALDAALSSLRLPNRPQHTFESLNPTLAKIAKGLQNSYKNVRVETNKGARNVDITRIYIPPKIRLRESQRNARHLEGVIKGIAPATISQQNISASLAVHVNPKEIENELSRVAFADLKASFSRIVVLGDPGGGKSTLCQRLCYDLAKNAFHALQYGDRPQIGQSEQKIPFRVILRQFEQARVKEPQLSLFDYLVRDTRQHVPGDVTDVSEALSYLFVCGRAVFAFDGLDEILETSRRREFVDLVQAFCELYPLCPSIITSRVVGYDSAPMPGDYEEYVLEKFDNAEVSEYTKKFFKVVGEHTEAEAAAQSQRFLQQTERNAADLRRNPLMLGLMAWLFNSQKDIPSNRPEIYRECAVLMFERWDPDRGILPDLPDDFDRLQLFSEIAARVYGDPKLSAGVERQWLETELRQYFGALYENRSKAIAAARSLLEFLVGRAWVMTEVGDRVFAFTHQTFLEYFFSRSIDDKFDTVAQLLKYMKPRIVRKEWDVVTHLALQLKTYRNARRQQEAINILIEWSASASSSLQKQAILSFLAKSMEYLSPSEAAVKDALSALFSGATELALKGNFVSFSNISMALESSRDRQVFLQSQAVKMFKDAVLSENDALSRIAVRALQGVNDRSRIHRGGFAHRATRDEVLKDTKSEILDRAKRTRRFVELQWSWYGVISEDLIRTHGIELFLKAELAGSLEDIGALSGLALYASEMYQHLLDNVAFPLSRRVAALRVFGSVGFSLPPFEAASVSRRPAGYIPEDAWLAAFESLDNDQTAFAGAIFAFQVWLEGHGGRHRARSTSQRNVSRGDLVRNKLLRKEMELVDSLRLSNPRLAASIEEVVTGERLLTS
ncbi:NACHT domain-containing protein [Caulobacter sp. NIBR1757]|uniref:NACHT domain-containing protein n=1 Tax=Caulobacter sp. NIBR1757 TaxID=3016000 RepID=UPI0022F022FD|nr:NACHT domain-containing protein [Caulobacter sp. NIBR1757]WGM38169.1 hypothetical protein AMEJIAPC_01071 [Caulobacter sp. NIBR1757]